MQIFLDKFLIFSVKSSSMSSRMILSTTKLFFFKYCQKEFYLGQHPAQNATEKYFNTEQKIEELKGQILYRHSLNRESSKYNLI